VFLTRGIIIERQYFFSADDVGISGAETDGKRITRFGRSAKIL
jgi:hypothetical protein